MEENRYARPFAAPRDPHAALLAEAEALERARGGNMNAPTFALLVPYRDIAAANHPLAASAQVHPDRLVWVVTVHADIITRGGLATRRN